MPNHLYLSLSTLVALDSLPSQLGLVREGLSNLFSHCFYRDLQVHKTVDGNAASYGLKLVTYKRLTLEAPGTGGLAVVLNPSLDPGVQGSHSEFPITVSYKWGILKHAKDFDLQSFDGSGASFFDLILDITGATKQELLTETLSVLTNDPDPIQQFIDLFNNDPSYHPAVPLQLHSFPTEAEVIADLLTQLISNGNDFDAYQIIFEQYIVSLNSLDDILKKLELLFQRWLGAFSIDNIKELLIPQVSASIDSLSVGVQFPSKILRQVDAQGKPIPDPQNPGEDKPALLSFDVASLKYSTATGLEFDLADSLNINFPRSEILKSGLILDLHEVKVDFSRTTNIPEAIADGRPQDFVGVYVKDGTITFPAFWKSAPGSTGIIKARNLLIGTGGFSGTLALEAATSGVSAPVVKFTFGKDFSVSLDTFSLTLKQNAITDSTIEGTLVIPGFKDANDNPAEIRIKVAIRQDGDFDVTAHEDDGFKTINCGGVFDLTLKSVFFGKKDDDFYIGVSGTIQFTQTLLSSLAPIEVEKLIIWSDGRFEIEGGTIPLPKNIRFPIGPAELSISAIHLGSHERINADGTKRNFRYIGFDGGVDINPGGVDVRGKGVRFYYPADLVNVASDSYLEIKSIAIDLVIPGSASKETATVLISGYLSIGGTQADPEYEGGITFALPKAKIAGGAAMKLRPKVPAFIVDAFVELSTPIPLGATSLGIYGFRGLFGQRYVATKAAADLDDTKTWFDYYKALKPTEGVNISKFEGPSLTKNYDSAFSIGAGVSLATTTGNAFSCKLFLLLSLPDLIYLEGKANILGPRVGLTGEDPPFFAYLAISSQSVETGFGVSYKLPREGGKKGWILDLNAEMRAAFFFKNSSAWYINFGTIQNPTTARVLTLFDATSYVMLSAAGIAAGAGVTFGFNKSYAGGLVKASVGVYIKVGGFISFERPQIGGFAMLGGQVDVSLLRFSFYLGIDTSLSVEAPKPFYIQGSVHLCVGVKILKKKIEKCFDVEFKWEKDSTVDGTPVLPFADVTKPNVLPPVNATNMLSGETFKVLFLGTLPPSASVSAFDQAVLPLDSWIDLEFLKGLTPGPNVDARIGRLSGQAPANAIDLIPPANVAHKVKHEYSIKEMEIKAWSGNAWVDYRPYQAMSPPAALVALGANASGYKDGFWQNSGEGFNKLRLLAETSLSYMQQGQPGWYVPEQFGITSATLFCRGNLRQKRCLLWVEVAPGTVYPDGAWRQLNTVLFRVSGGPGTVIDWSNHLGVPRSLVFSNEGIAQVVFNEPCVEATLTLTTFSTGAVIRFYKRETAGAGFVYTRAETRTLTQLELLAPVKYNNPAVPIAKVEIDPINADPATVYALRVQIDLLYRQLYEGDPAAPPPAELLAMISAREQELAQIKGLGCTPQIDRETLVRALPALQQQIDECLAELAALQAAQQEACKKATELRVLFEHCFPRPPPTISYEITKRIEPGHPVEFGFRVFDYPSGGTLFDSVQPYTTALTAERAALNIFELGLWPGNYALMAPPSGDYFLQLVDTSGRFTAVSPARFTTWNALVLFWNQIPVRMRTAQTEENCAECTDHLDCWSELSAFDNEGANCGTIVDGLLGARQVYCSTFNQSYRDLYECYQQRLDEAIRHCQKLTLGVSLQEQACQALSDQLAAIQELIGFLDSNHLGALLPPEAFPCSTLLHEACCLSLQDYEFNISVPSQEAIEEDYANAVQAIQKMLTPMWRPDTKYYVRLQVTDTVNGQTLPPNPFDFYFGFRTAGPLGYFHTDPSANYVDTLHGKTPDQYMLTGLKGYIDYLRSYPNADGQLIGAKPLFYEDARILLFFTKRYVYHFFGDWPAYNGLPALTGNAMQIIIKDPAENTSFPNPPSPLVTTTEIPRAVVSWTADHSPRIPEDVRTLLYLRNPELLNPDFAGEDCWETGGDMVKPASVSTSVTPQYLKPLKLYTAVVNNVYQGQTRKVHDFVFQTSRYPDFAAQVNSYQLDDGKGNQRDAIFRIDVSLSVADISLMFDVVSGNMSAPNAALAGTWADSFDRLVEGVIKLAPLDAAISTEFNIIHNSVTHAVVAVWIRNPEPFNDPKLPDDVLERSLGVMNGLNSDPTYAVLFSKDRSQAFVMHPSRVIPVTQVKFRFAYIEWDGSNYVDRDVVITGAIHTNI